jgi:hypothetical protein
MIGVTVFGLLLTPVFYVLLRGSGKSAPVSAPVPPVAASETAHV